MNVSFNSCYVFGLYLSNNLSGSLSSVQKKIMIVGIAIISSALFCFGVYRCYKTFFSSKILSRQNVPDHPLVANQAIKPLSPKLQPQNQQALSPSVYLIACHVNPADHFSNYLVNRDKSKFHIYATGPALKKFAERKIEVASPFSLDQLSDVEQEELAVQIAKACAVASAVLTDVGHPFDLKLQKALAIYARNAPLCYYNNTEAEVPGGYSKIAAEVMLAANKILFANANLATEPLYSEPGKEMDLGDRGRIGIGYYPLDSAEKIAERRKLEKIPLREKLLAARGLPDKGQQIVVYFGGNNEKYFNEAFPYFLSFLCLATNQADLSDTIILLQQHPGAKAKNLDSFQLANWIEGNRDFNRAPQFFLSEWNTEEAQIVADKALYYQTSMGPQFIWSNIPTIQIGKEIYQDMLVKNQLCSTVTNEMELLDALKKEDEKQTLSKEALIKALGIRDDWLKNFEEALQVR